MFAGPSTSLVNRRRSRSRILHFEQLEQRRLLSITINWSNRDDLFDNRFEDVFGNDLIDTDGDSVGDTPRFDVARNVVDAALAAWAQAFDDWNHYADDQIDMFIRMGTEVQNGVGGFTFPDIPDVLPPPSLPLPDPNDPLVFAGTPDGGTITLGRGNGGADWFLDTSPWEHSEFLGITDNAFVGEAPQGTAASELNDLYSHVVHEMAHALGILPAQNIWGSPPFIMPYRWERLAPNGALGGDLNAAGHIDMADPGDLWTYDDGTSKALYTTDNAGAYWIGLHPLPLHIAAPHASNVHPLNGPTQFFGARDLHNAALVRGSRYLPSRLTASVIAEVYGHDLASMSSFPDFYVQLAQPLASQPGTLLVRGGSPGDNTSGMPDTGNSNDIITVSQHMSGRILAHVDLGVDVPGTNMDGVIYNRSFSPANVGSVRVLGFDGVNSGMSGDGDDQITLDFTNGNWIPAEGILVDGGTGTNSLVILGPPNTDYEITRSELTVTGCTMAPCTISFSGISDMTVIAHPASSNNSMTVSETGMLQRLVLVGSDGPSGNDGQDTISIVDTDDALLDLEIRSMGGTDRITVEQLGARARLNLDGGGEDDLVILGANAGTLNSFQAGPPHTIGGGAGTGDLLIMQDFNTLVPAVYNFDAVNPSGPGAITRVVAGAQFFEHDSVEQVILHAGTGNDSLFIKGTPIDSDLRVFGNDGDEDFFVGTGGSASVVQKIRSHVTIHGDVGANTAVVDDTGNSSGNTVTVTETTVGAGSSDSFFGIGGKLEYHDLSDGTNLVDLIIRTGNGSDTINIESTAQGTDTTIFAQRGSDKITVTGPPDSGQQGTGPGEGTIDEIKSLLIIHGQLGDDILTVIDDSDTSADIMTLTDTTIGMPTTDTFLGTASAGIVYTSIFELGIFMGSGGNQAFVESTHPDTDEVVLKTGAGNDTLLLGNSIVNLIRSKLNIDGQDGNDMVTVDDTTEAVPSTLAVTPDQVLGDGTFFGSGGELTYSDWEDLIVNAGLAGDTVTVTGTNPVNPSSAGTVTTLNTGGGTDLVTVGLAGTVDYVRSPLVINGGSVPSAVVALHDPSDLTPDEFTITDRYVAAAPGDKFFGPFGSLQYSNVHQLNVAAGLGDNLINLQSTNPSTRYLIGGGGGNDSFLIDSNGPRNSGGTVDFITSPVELIGGVGSDAVIMDDSDDPSGDVVSIVSTGTESGTIGRGSTDNLFGTGGSVDYDQMAAVGLRTSSFADTVHVAPSTGTSIVVLGNETISDPNSDDALSIDLSGVGTPTLTLTDYGSGELSSSTHASVYYAGMEIIDEASGGNRYDLVVDMNNVNLPGNDGAADEIDAASGQLQGRKTLNLLINGKSAYAGYEAAVNSLVVLGSSDQDTFEIVETPDGLPTLVGTAPGSHTNATFLSTQVTPKHVSIHFDGGVGQAIDGAVLTTMLDVSKFDDSVGPLKSAVMNIDGVLSMSYVNLEPVLLQGNDGTALIDPNSLRDLTTLSITALDDGSIQVSGDGGFETTVVSGLAQLLIRPPIGVKIMGFDGPIESDSAIDDLITSIVIERPAPDASDVSNEFGQELAIDPRRSVGALVESDLGQSFGADDYVPLVLADDTEAQIELLAAAAPPSVADQLTYQTYATLTASTLPTPQSAVSDSTLWLGARLPETIGLALTDLELDRLDRHR